MARRNDIGMSDTDRGFSDALALLSGVKAVVTDVGFLGGEQHPSEGDEQPITIAQVAAWNEYGTETIPERPFMRRTVDTNADKYKRLMGKLLARAMTIRGAPAKRARDVFTVVGAQVSSDVVKTIDAGGFAPNSEATIKRKGSSKPLVDTGVMRASTAFRVSVNGTAGGITKSGGSATAGEGA